MEDNLLIGLKFGKLTVLKQDEDYVSKNGSHHKKFICECECGNIVSVYKEHLLSGKTKSCGCLRHDGSRYFKHGQIHTRLYRIWGNMVNRCTNPNNPGWCKYGEVGINVCDEWLSFENFYKWANENGYRDDLTIDRIDNNGGYNPSNCRWADRIIQANNKSDNHIIEYNGESKTIAEWARTLNVPYKSLHHRIVSLNWDINRAFTQPYRKSRYSDCQTNK